MSLDRYLKDEKIVFVVGFMKDKEYKAALSKLKDLKNDISFVAVNVETNARGEDANELKELVATVRKEDASAMYEVL